MALKSEKTAAELFMAQALAKQVRLELKENILPYWQEKMTDPAGGFHGRIDGHERLDPEAPEGAIMIARILWTFACAYRTFKGSAEAESYLETALRAKREIIGRFFDSGYGGIYWSIDCDGSPRDTKKQIYAIAFAIYGLAELNRATGDGEALEYAIKLFNSIEDHSFDPVKDGYFEAFTRNWERIDDMRLSEKDANESKTMNTHLHVLEAYTCLFRVWSDSRLKARLRGLIEIFTDKILGPDGHLRLFFDEDWKCSYDIVSYGHDIEASWLLHEAALVLGDEDILSRVESLVPTIVSASLEGFSHEGGMIYEMHRSASDSQEHTSIKGEPQGIADGDRHWWVQAETVVGCFNLWDSFGDPSGLENALMCWEFIKANLIDRENGEWFWSLRSDGSLNRDEDKAGFWKCPYHNGRMCMEILERTSSNAKP